MADGGACGTSALFSLTTPPRALVRNISHKRTDGEIEGGRQGLREGKVIEVAPCHVSKDWRPFSISYY